MANLNFNIKNGLSVGSGGTILSTVGSSIGIGKTNPSSTLDIVGGVSATGSGLFGGPVTGTTGTFSGNVSGTGGSFTGPVSGTTGTFTGNVSGVAGYFTGPVTGTGATFTGAVSGLSFTGSGAGLTSLSASQLVGSIPNSAVSGVTYYIGTTELSLGRASGSQTLTGVSIDGNSATSGTAVNVSGGTGTFSLGTVSSPSITFTGDTNTGIYSPGADQIALATGGTGRVFVDASGNVGIGTSSPGTKLDVLGDIRTPGRGTSFGYKLPDWRVYNSTTDNALVFDNYITECLRIDSSGRLLVGASSSIDGYQLQIADTAGYNLSLFSFSSTSAYGPDITLNHSLSGTVGTQTTVVNGSHLGRIVFRGSDGSGFKNAAAIETFVDGTPGTNDMPGRLVFSTTADGASSPTERMRITNSGLVSINEPSPPSGYTLYTNGQSRKYSSSDFTVSTTRKGSHEIFSSSGSNQVNNDTWSDQKSALYVRGWLENGNNGESASVLLLKGEWSAATNAGYLIKGYRQSGASSTSDSGSGTVCFRVHNTGNVTNTNNSYGAISDERLKQDISDVTSYWEDIKNVRVRKFRFKNEVEEYGENAPILLGVIAQELEQVSPGLIEQAKLEDGSPDPEAYKSVKYSVLYMKSVKALQEAMERIESLEARIAVLEGA